MATVINDKFQAQNGFESPNFTVDNTGKLTTPTIDVQSILLNGTPFVAYVPPEDDGGDDTGTQVSNSFESLAVTGGIFKVNYLGSTASTINMNGASVKGDVNIADNVVLINQPTVGTHATSKGYVDATATALAVAFGA